MKAKKKNNVPYRSVKRLQQYFEDLSDYNEYPLGDIYELGQDGIYRQASQ